MRKYRQPKPIGGNSRIKVPKSSLAFKRAQAKQAEADFVAKLFRFVGMEETPAV
jgi:hypothetical protein